MGDLLRMIENFNRKERFFLFAYATGNDNRGLILSEEFRKRLGIALEMEIPADAMGYIDYHLDWLHAAVVLANDPMSATPRPNWQPWTDEPASRPPLPWVSTGNQEDVDLLVGFECDGVTWLVLIEAKAETGWTNKQLWSKSERLSRIFGSDSIDPDAALQPRFCLMSPHRPQRLVPPAGSAWPRWMVRQSAAHPEGEFDWLELKVPGSRKKVTGSDATGSPSSHRKFWMVTDVHGPDTLVE